MTPKRPHIALDIVAITLLMYASGGIRSGLGVMLLISGLFVVRGAVMGPKRNGTGPWGQEQVMRSGDIYIVVVVIIPACDHIAMVGNCVDNRVAPVHSGSDGACVPDVRLHAEMLA